jgi:hypothetical protein
MKSKKIKIIILLGFLTLFIGSALTMYFKYVYKQPRIKIIAPRTEYDPIKVDSALRSQKGYKR